MKTIDTIIKQAFYNAVQELTPEQIAILAEHFGVSE
jgi:hypothetical protein